MSLTANIRMYHVGELGDCFLLTFREGNKRSDVLIDCGSFRNKDTSARRLQKIVKHIKSDLGDKKLDIVVGTHQHNDHVSGFVHAEKEFTGLVSQVWLSWLDNPSDGFATQVYNEQKKLVKHLQAIHAQATGARVANLIPAVTDMLGFYAADGKGDPEIPAKGVALLKTLGAHKPQYLKPGETRELPKLEGQVKVHVLGPPRNKAALFDSKPGKEESYDHSLALAGSMAEKLLSGLKHASGDASLAREEHQFPFNQHMKRKFNQIDPHIQKVYNNKTDSWRKIDNDWLEEANSLALYLDTYTNNSSLVLAFELVESGKVLLFAADAQTGNWASWEHIKWEKNGVTTDKLLRNTVLYKVGHHASHNATLVAGLEAMTHPELVAMIPVDESDPNIAKKKGWKMPAKNLYQRLKEKTRFRVLRMENFYADGCHPVTNKKQAKWNELPFKPKQDKSADKLYVEYMVQG